MTTKSIFTRLATISLMAGVGLLLAGPKDPKDTQTTFATPLDAIQATIAAAGQNDTAALMQLFGPDGADIVASGDPAQDKALRAEFVRAAGEKLQLEEVSPSRVIFSVGAEGWPFPIPVVRKGDRWRLDAAGGKMEILARRIGRNELNALQACRGYAEAQFEYAANPHDGDAVLKYAQLVFSSEGKQDGLYSAGEQNRAVPMAFAEAVATGKKKTAPYHGYYFRVLKAQGPDASGGAFDYVVNNRMIGGFALVAWPAEYGVSGISTLVINQDGVVFQKDLGASGTASLAGQMTRFNPDKSWRAVVLE